MRVRFAVNAQEERTQRSILIYLARQLLVFYMFAYTFFYSLSRHLISSSPFRVYGAVSMEFI